MEKTLVILIGNARGGEKTWHTMYEHLLKPFNADLALCFGYKENKTESLYEKAKYIWELPEYEEWADFYVENFGEHGIWKPVFEAGKEIGFSGLYGSRGSSAITFAFRHWLLKNKKDILTQYDRLVVTRSDHFYDRDHPLLDNNYFWVPEGEGYGGLCDRHHVFPSSDVDIVFGIVEKYVNTPQIVEDFWHREKKYNDEIGSYKLHLNIEQVFMKYFTNNGYFDKIRECERVQFTVKTAEDTTRWWNGDGSKVPGHPDLYQKYGHECVIALKHVENYTVSMPNVDENGNRLMRVI